MKLKNKVISFLPFWMRNKFILLGLAFLVWMIAFDKYSLITQIRLSHTIYQMEKEKANFQDKELKASSERASLNTDLEKFAREKYLMHKPEEEVYLVVDKSNR